MPDVTVIHDLSEEIDVAFFLGVPTNFINNLQSGARWTVSLASRSPAAMHNQEGTTVFLLYESVIELFMGLGVSREVASSQGNIAAITAAVVPVEQQTKFDKGTKAVTVIVRGSTAMAGTG
ncbi:hypothetical protein DEU56DRAFT_975972 [Suillus clintonianus]|uniref:uncharacterized protein n=1 Tax=Suillus clintonianus TaxID=1904413 RepID=UPI001B861F8B|nr:uncharacterized protein DEU56DRAFT_975972 [Suillus clintonianus]KAG2156406.1 hypothetical protein DEU56DRAFT_975972 [Suillus clintonianus]